MSRKSSHPPKMLTSEQQAQMDEKLRMTPDALTITRPMCMVMNELARLIAGCEDDWWKK